MQSLHLVSSDPLSQVLLQSAWHNAQSLFKSGFQFDVAHVPVEHLGGLYIGSANELHADESTQGPSNVVVALFKYFPEIHLVHLEESAPTVH